LRRIVVIVGALLAGLVGLFMSVCGGGVLIGLGYNTVISLSRGLPANVVGNLFFLAVPVGFTLLGVFVVVKCVKKIRDVLKARDDEE
jgi:TRAP-type C4-dicarboxylate transport system permease small subunit